MQYHTSQYYPKNMVITQPLTTTEYIFAQYHHARKNTPFSYSNKLEIQSVCKWYFCILECVKGSKRFCMMLTLSIA